MYKRSLSLIKTNQQTTHKVARSNTQRDTSLANILDAPHSGHSVKSHSNQSIGYHKESIDWCLYDPKEHREARDLRGNWLKVCYFLHIIHSQSTN